ncbi:MAG: VOC family protein [Myxococcales bacterium]|nr:VOC family protein [Myxococcales bacterium]
MSNDFRSTLMPMLPYRDAPAAIRFLCDAFGFEERMRYEMPDGSIGHAELTRGDAVISLATVWDAGGLASACELEALHCQLMCFVDDVEAHYARARAAGATVITQPENQHGMRTYRALDCEGQRWIFAQQLHPLDERDTQGA